MIVQQDVPTALLSPEVRRNDREVNKLDDSVDPGAENILKIMKSLKTVTTVLPPTSDPPLLCHD